MRFLASTKPMGYGMSIPTPDAGSGTRYITRRDFAMALPPDRIAYSPIIDRPTITWPNKARVAFWVAPNVEHYEYLPPLDGLRNPWPRMPHPDVQQYSAHEYGNRVGFWRVLEVLDHYHIRCSTTLNIGVLAHFPEIADAMLQRDWTFVNHGFYNTRYVTTYAEEQERDFLHACRETFQRLTGRPLQGHSGPAASNTERTPDLLAETGFLYQTDWKIDDQPVPVKVRSGKLVCIPYTSELNDAPLFRHHYEADYYAEICKAQFDQLYQEGEENGRLMCIAFHPYAMGRPHRVKYLDDVLRYIMSHNGVWQTTTDEIAAYYLAHYYDQSVAHAEQVNT
jgi:peptidoglycan/xylan/chitin deacetylase (PgdA/CDA1 family)